MAGSVTPQKAEIVAGRAGTQVVPDADRDRH